MQFKKTKNIDLYDLNELDEKCGVLDLILAVTAVKLTLALFDPSFSK